MSRTRAAADGASSSMSDMARAMARGSPASTRSAREGDAVTSGSQQLSRDYQALHLARAFADGQELHIAEVFLRGVVLDEAVAAVNLHPVLGRINRRFAGEQLRHCRGQRHRTSLISEPGGTVGQQARR